MKSNTRTIKNCSCYSCYSWTKAVQRVPNYCPITQLVHFFCNVKGYDFNEIHKGQSSNLEGHRRDTLWVVLVRVQHDNSISQDGRRLGIGYQYRRARIALLKKQRNIQRTSWRSALRHNKQQKQIAETAQMIEMVERGRGPEQTS